MFSKVDIVRDFSDFLAKETGKLTTSHFPVFPLNSGFEKSELEVPVSVENVKILKAKNCLKDLKLSENKFVKQVRCPVTIFLDTETKNCLKWLYEYLYSKSVGLEKLKIEKLASVNNKITNYEVFNTINTVKYMRNLEIAYREAIQEKRYDDSKKRLIRISEFECPVLQFILGIDKITVSYNELLSRLGSYSQNETYYKIKLLIRNLYKKAFKVYMQSPTVEYTDLLQVYLYSLLRETVKLNLIGNASLSSKFILSINSKSESFLNSVETDPSLLEKLLPVNSAIVSFYGQKLSHLNRNDKRPKE